MTLEDGARRLADEQRRRDAVAGTAADARQPRMVTPTPEGLEFVSFCRTQGVAPVPIMGYRQKRWSGKSVETIVGRGWPLDVYDGGMRSGSRLCVLEDGVVVILSGHSAYFLRERVDPMDLPGWVGSAHPSLKEILTKAASDISIQKEDGRLRPPF